MNSRKSKKKGCQILYSEYINIIHNSKHDTIYGCPGNSPSLHLIEYSSPLKDFSCLF